MENTPSTTSRFDDDGNEIKGWQKRIAGVILFSTMAFCILYIIGHWPDRLPAASEQIEPYYSYRWFHVTLQNVTKLGNVAMQEQDLLVKKTGIIPDVAKDSLKKDSTAINQEAKPKLIENPGVKDTTDVCKSHAHRHRPQERLIHLNTLLLILVAVGGFLGNMIYITSSFSTYIGSGQFRKSWALWYWLKPITAAGLALAIYFIFRGGFLNMSDNSISINLYGVMTMAILTGLFTDRATLKLKEVFEVILRPQEPRPGGLKNNLPQVKDVKAAPLEPGKPENITLTGVNLKEGKIAISIEGQAITTFDIREDAVSFTYTLPDTLAAKESVLLSVKFAEDQAPQTFTLKVKTA